MHRRQRSVTQTRRNRPGGFFVVNNLYLLDWGCWSEFGHLSEGSKGFKEAAASQWFSPARLLVMLHIYFPSRASVRLGHQSLLLSFTETPTPDWERKIQRKRSCSVWCPHAVAAQEFSLTVNSIIAHISSRPSRPLPLFVGQKSVNLLVFSIAFRRMRWKAHCGINISSPGLGNLFAFFFSTAIAERVCSWKVSLFT